MTSHESAETSAAKLDRQIKELAAALASQAEAIATGSLVGPRRAAVKRMLNNVDTLLSWVTVADATPSKCDGTGEATR